MSPPKTPGIAEAAQRRCSAGPGRSRAAALLQLAKEASAPQIAGMVPLTPQAIRKIGQRYREGGLERALYEKQRPSAEALLKDSEN